MIAPLPASLGENGNPEVWYDEFMTPIAPALPSFGTIPSPILALLLWAVLGLVVLIGVIVSLILFYHWVRYGHTMLMISTGGLIYFIGAGILLVSAVGSLSGYVTSLP